MNRVSFWDVLAIVMIVFSAVNIFCGKKIHLFGFISDSRVEIAVTCVLVFLLSRFISRKRKPDR